MALMGESVWRGRMFLGGWTGAGGGGGGKATANIEAFTETRWVRVRGDITPYPF